MTYIPHDVIFNSQDDYYSTHDEHNSLLGGGGVNYKKLRIQRIMKDLTQEELAKLANVDRAYISRIETGKITPSLSVLTRIASALECSVKDFF